jgi:hypothetical protein
MNDKFLEILSKSSGRTITRPYDGSLLIKLDLPELEKFAELIIKECDRYITERFDECEPWMTPGDLLEHFGVEE